MLTSMTTDAYAAQDDRAVHMEEVTRQHHRGRRAQQLHEAYLHCIDSREDIVSQRIEEALDTSIGSSLPPQGVKASGCAHRRLPRDPVRYVSVISVTGPRLAHGLLPEHARTEAAQRPCRPTVNAAHTVLSGPTLNVWGRPDIAHA